MVSTNEAMAEQMGMKKPALRVVEEPKLDDFDRSIIGRAIRIEVPFTDLYKLRDVAELLRGLADDIEFTAKRTDHPPVDSRLYKAWRRSTLFYLRFRARQINMRIRELHGRHNKNGTTR